MFQACLLYFHSSIAPMIMAFCYPFLLIKLSFAFTTLFCSSLSHISPSVSQGLRLTPSLWWRPLTRMQALYCDCKGCWCSVYLVDERSSSQPIALPYSPSELQPDSIVLQRHFCLTVAAYVNDTVLKTWSFESQRILLIRGIICWRSRHLQLYSVGAVA